MTRKSNPAEVAARSEIRTWTQMQVSGELETVLASTLVCYVELLLVSRRTKLTYVKIDRNEKHIGMANLETTKL